MNPTDRVIILIDMDCFYCQVEEQLDPQLKGKPIAVVQYNTWRGGGIIAVNYPARDEGVTRHMRGNEAKKKCPIIKLVRVPEVRGKADLSRYRDAGKKVADVLASFTSLLQRASVDEAYLDITELVNQRLEANLDHLTISNLKNTFVVGYDTEDFLHIVKNEKLCEANLKLAVGGLIAEEIRRDVLEKTGYQCSAGIAHNKILAKLVCGLHKPNKQTILPQDAVEQFFETMPINKIKSLGGKFGKTLTEDLQVTYMGQLLKFTEKELVQRFDQKTGNWLYNVARGIDLEPVTTKLISKSIACCKNFQGKAALTTAEVVQHWLNELADEIAERLVKDLKENNRKSKQLVVSFTQEIDKRDLSRSRTHPLTSYEPKRIAQNAFEVIKKTCFKAGESFRLKFLGLSAGHFEDVKKVREITSFFKFGEPQESVSCARQFSPIHLSDNDSFKMEDSSTIDDEEEVDPNVYLQLTQELEENVEDLIFYDNRIEQEEIENIQLEGNSSIKHLDKRTDQSSFFKQYFGQSKTVPEALRDCENVFEGQGSIDNCQPLSVEEETEICSDCNKNIRISELPSHKDYHFALTLLKSERNVQTPAESTKTDKKSNKRKAVGNKDLRYFFKKEDALDESSANIVKCEECKRHIKVDEVPNHMDYHLAKKVHLDINSVVACQRPVKTKVHKKNKPSNNNKSMTTFLKRL